jgi:UDP-galactopyranose mutase
MSDDGWIDELFDGKPTPITYRQLVTIESNIDLTSFTTQMISDIINGINDLTEEEAELIITKIYENRYEKDTQKQWKKMLRDGVFD